MPSGKSVPARAYPFCPTCHRLLRGFLSLWAPEGRAGYPRDVSTQQEAIQTPMDQPLGFPKDVPSFIDWYVGQLDHLPEEPGSYDQTIYRLISEANIHAAMYGCTPLIHVDPLRWECSSEVCPAAGVDTVGGIPLPKGELRFSRSGTPTQSRQTEAEGDDHRPASS